MHGILRPLGFSTLMLVAGCGSFAKLGGLPGETDGAETSGSGAGSDGDGDTAGGDDGFREIHRTVTKEVDILFVVDNSGSMGEEQGKLVMVAPTIIDVLEAPGIEANYRIAVTTTDNGNPWCSGTTPEEGKFRSSSCRARLDEFVFTGTDPFTDQKDKCLDACAYDSIVLEPTTTELDATPRPRPWIENIEKVTNLPEGVTTQQAFACLAPQGINGCGFEQPLESMMRALLRARDGKTAEYGFLRKNAHLAVVLVTDEVDCSYNVAADGAEIFAANSNKVFWSDPSDSYPTSAVCWNAGVACSGGPGTYKECHAQNYDVDGNPTDDANAVLQPLSRYVGELTQIRDQKRAYNPELSVTFIAISGVPTRYPQGGEIVYQDAADPRFQEDFGIGPGCNSATGKAVPPVRERELAEALSGLPRGPLHSICDGTYMPAFEPIARLVADPVSPACHPGCVADSDPSTAVLEPVCEVREKVPSDQGLVSSPIQECIPTCAGIVCPRHQADGWQMPIGDEVCYRMLVDNGSPATPSPIDGLSASCMAAGANLEFAVERSAPPPGGTKVEAKCEPSPDPIGACGP